MNRREIKRGELYYADLGKPQFPGEQAGYRIVCITQNDVGNKYSPTVIVACLTSQQKKYIPTHVQIKKSIENGLFQDSIILCEQIKTISKERLHGKSIGRLNSEEIEKLDKAIDVSLGRKW